MTKETFTMAGTWIMVLSIYYARLQLMCGL